MILPPGNQLEDTLGKIHQGTDWPDDPGSKSFVSIGLYAFGHHKTEDYAYHHISDDKA
jgi:hypothetical protein